MLRMQRLIGTGQSDQGGSIALVKTAMFCRTVLN